MLLRAADIVIIYYTHILNYLNVIIAIILQMYAVISIKTKYGTSN